MKENKTKSESSTSTTTRDDIYDQLFHLTSHTYKSESLGLVSVINKTHTSPPVGVLPFGAVLKQKFIYILETLTKRSMQHPHKIHL